MYILLYARVRARGNNWRKPKAGATDVGARGEQWTSKRERERETRKETVNEERAAKKKTTTRRKMLGKRARLIVLSFITSRFSFFFSFSLFLLSEKRVGY